jgi:hypothetical protein
LNFLTGKEKDLSQLRKKLRKKYFNPKIKMGWMRVLEKKLIPDSGKKATNSSNTAAQAVKVGVQFVK